MRTECKYCKYKYRDILNVRLTTKMITVTEVFGHLLLMLPGCLFPRRYAEILCRKYYNLTGNTDKTLLQKEHLIKLVHLSNFIIIFYSLKCENLRTYTVILYACYAINGHYSQRKFCRFIAHLQEAARKKTPWIQLGQL